jgi:hypothetical protein
MVTTGITGTKTLACKNIATSLWILDLASTFRIPCGTAAATSANSSTY